MAVLEDLIAVRVHLDDSGPDNGPLRVVPGSHRLGRIPRDQQAALRLEFGEVECHVPRGGALLMKPLLLHASSKATGPRQRRVLHFLYGPPELPLGLEWAQGG
jgi:ectoine hydroxylase-related dioxygenase (phytanoyl-CoA dioxygenase family)